MTTKTTTSYPLRTDHYNHLTILTVILTPPQYTLRTTPISLTYRAFYTLAATPPSRSDLSLIQVLCRGSTKKKTTEVPWNCPTATMPNSSEVRSVLFTNARKRSSLKVTLLDRTWDCCCKLYTLPTVLRAAFGAGRGNRRHNPRVVLVEVSACRANLATLLRRIATLHRLSESRVHRG